MYQKTVWFLSFILISILFTGCGTTKDNKETTNQESSIKESKEDVISIINKVNTHWQKNNLNPGNAFWHVSAYHTGNMEAYKITKNKQFLDYSLAWAEKNQWMGAKSQDKSEWRYNYGENDKYVLFGDWQICFQTYIDLYNFTGKKDAYKMARAREVMEYQMSTSANDYWWWADGLYMVMPVMTKLYKATGNDKYLEKLEEYLTYADGIMYDDEAQLYYRDAKYVYPKHKSANGKKDFWARGDGWVFAGYAKIIQDMPDTAKHKQEYIKRFKAMAEALAASQQKEGYWTRSILDPAHAPGPETSGTAFFTYAFLWGINNNILDKEVYTPVINKSWNYLINTALQANGAVGYVQPIGEKAIPGQVVNVNSTADFGVGAFLLAASEMYRFLN
ncbi:family 88 glycosyl hydrolase [Polaribacter reichenbachii]|uniref:Glycosyl hydrolase family 88 n=1 Tax=Polaribacter reichenbachii TaxID=996801 RepID=A0A1B8U6B1_9FLAO|nr:glycoside hydrolase family 88 protein [Polaribacter reichenbachii]APZ45926.1 family 88 glycosyl hydrolase [Polaribacter reichenbachii]AUC19788.1 family 88 glycosyl hydrolase [Polaribacter reichenbachii]OBY67359.1 glycosyl hydrolase family 88 [Polaribacter reichenbachii]